MIGNRRVVTAIAFVLFVALFAQACGAPSAQAPTAAPAAAAKPLKMGAQSSFTGSDAAYGKTSKDGIELARKHINEAGGLLGRPVEFVYRDTKGDPKEGAAVAQEFCQDPEINVVIGDAASSVSLAAMPIYQECNKILVSGLSGHPDLTKNFKNFFRSIVPSSWSFKFAANFFIDEFSPQRIAILYPQSDWGVSGKDFWLDVLKQRNMTPVAVEAHLSDLKDFKAIITSMKAKNPDMVLIASYYQDAAVFLQQARELDFNPKFVGTAAISNQALIDIGGKAAEGVYEITGFAPDSPRPEVQKFVQAVKEVYGFVPQTMFEALNYDAVMLAAASIKRTKSYDPKVLVPDLTNNTKNFPAVTGDITFGPDREPYKDMFTLVVKDGKFVTYVSQKRK